MGSLSTLPPPTHMQQDAEGRPGRWHWSPLRSGLGRQSGPRFFRIVLPLSLPVLLVAVLIRAIETFKIFDVSINSVAWLCFTSKLEALLDVESNSFYAGV
jgi:hypothetical protein